jgi:hypothetical protein
MVNVANNKYYSRIKITGNYLFFLLLNSLRSYFFLGLSKKNYYHIYYDIILYF